MNSNNNVAFTVLISLGYPIERARVAIIALSGIKLINISNQLEIPRQNIEEVIKGKRNTKWIQKRIANLLKIPVNTFF